VEPPETFNLPEHIGYANGAPTQLDLCAVPIATYTRKDQINIAVPHYTIYGQECVRDALTHGIMLIVTMVGAVYPSAKGGIVSCLLWKIWAIGRRE
jgi:hypothetical protein